MMFLYPYEKSEYHAGNLTDFEFHILCELSEIRKKYTYLLIAFLLVAVAVSFHLWSILL